MSPTFTIAIPVYERLFGFEEALRSALSVQGVGEVLVVDDLSSHSTFEKICLSMQDPRVHYFRNKENFGLFGNWNRCVELATSEFIAILCSDDFVSANIYTRFLEAYRQFPDIDVFFGSYATFTHSIADAQVGRSFPQGITNPKYLLENAAVNGACFPVLSVIRRAKLLRYPFVANPHSGNDWYWIYSNASRLHLYADAEPLSYWRRHSNQDAATSAFITTDCWPMMYSAIASQLKQFKSRKAKLAKRRAVGVVLTWLLNDKGKDGPWQRRLRSSEVSHNFFLQHAVTIGNESKLTSKLIKKTKLWPIYYNIGRFLRKVKFYPHSYLPHA